ncbi:hypothetical protein THOM_0533 [Trachipleistophora hominis]|uniref:Uncharacterized protein n=1 Tax=Trachipleistophora hominis TaxID=72359 RepID=L7JYV7_TRAHO|nr:hypothetical protein THOM_0533 [Trachipleistophora hominis]
MIYTASHTFVAQISEASERELHLYDHDNMRVINEYLTMFLSRNSWDELFGLAEKSCPIYPTIHRLKLAHTF